MDEIWGLREWLLLRARRVEWTLRGYGRGVAEDAVHEVLARAARERIPSDDLKRRALSMLGTALDKQLGWPYKRWRKGMPATFHMDPNSGLPDAAGFARPDHPPLAEAFPTDELAECATAIAERTGKAEAVARWGEYEASKLRRAVVAAAAGWVGRPPPAKLAYPGQSLARKVVAA